MYIFCRIINAPLSQTNASAKVESSREERGPCGAGKRSFSGGGKMEASNEGEKGAVFEAGEGLKGVGSGEVLKAEASEQGDRTTDSE
jgi:hypothetical protein